MVDIFFGDKKFNREGCTAVRPQNGGLSSFLGQIWPVRTGRDLPPTALARPIVGLNASDFGNILYMWRRTETELLSPPELPEHHPFAPFLRDWIQSNRLNSVYFHTNWFPKQSISPLFPGPGGHRKIDPFKKYGPLFFTAQIDSRLKTPM